MKSGLHSDPDIYESFAKYAVFKHTMQEIIERVEFNGNPKDQVRETAMRANKVSEAKHCVSLLQNDQQ